MRKLYLLLDEWKNDRNFVGSELEIIKQHFDVTVICNDFSDKSECQYPEGVKFLFYKRKAGIRALLYGIKFFFDKESYKELANIKNESAKISKLSEIIRFYINGELFYKYLRDNELVEKNSDAIYYSYWYFWKCFAVAKHKSKFSNIKLITRCHGYDIYKDQIPTGYQAYKRFMDSRLDKVIFISEHGMDYYLNEFNIAKSEKHVLYRLGTFNDYDIEQLIKIPVKKEYIRIVSCSSVIELKRVDLIINALSCIDDVQIEWTHFGAGPLFSDIKLLSEERLSHKTNIKYDLKGYVENSEILRFYFESNIDAFIMTSRSEGNPISVIEAMSFGIPVIATDINNMSKLVCGNGTLISANPEPQELAAVIKTLPFENSIKAASRSMWERDFQGKINNQRFVEEVLDKL